MVSSLRQWFDSKPFAQQLIVLALVFDPLGFLAGYLLGPALGVSALMGGVYGLVAASLPTSLHVMRHANQQ